jgi:hypothetical protein
VSENNIIPKVFGLEEVEVINYFTVSHEGIFRNLYTFRTASVVREVAPTKYRQTMYIGIYVEIKIAN